MVKNPEKYLIQCLVLINFTEKLTLLQILLKDFDHKKGTPILYITYITPFNTCLLHLNHRHSSTPITRCMMYCFLHDLWKQAYKDPGKSCFLEKWVYEKETNSFKHFYEGNSFSIRIQAKILKL